MKMMFGLFLLISFTDSLSNLWVYEGKPVSTGRQLVQVCNICLCSPACLFVVCWFFSKATFLKNTTRVSNSLYPDQAWHFVRPDLSPNCLQRLSADDTSRQRVKCKMLCIPDKLSNRKEKKQQSSDWYTENNSKHLIEIQICGSQT